MTSNVVIIACVVIICGIDLGTGIPNPNIRSMMRPGMQMAPPRKLAPVMCAHDTLMIYQDCRLCVCPKPNRVAKCFRKTCDLRTKDGGQCPMAVMRMDDGKLCNVVQGQGCKIDADCPGPQLCCFDFCAGSKCVNPVPLDVITGGPPHNGRGYQ